MGNIGPARARFDVLPAPEFGVSADGRLVEWWPSGAERATVPQPEPMPAPVPGPTPEPIPGPEPVPGPIPGPSPDPAPVPSPEPGPGGPPPAPRADARLRSGR